MRCRWGWGLAAWFAVVGGGPVAAQGVGVLELMRTRLNAASAVGVGKVAHWTDTQFGQLPLRAEKDPDTPERWIVHSLSFGMDGAFQWVPQELEIRTHFGTLAYRPLYVAPQASMFPHPFAAGEFAFIVFLQDPDELQPKTPVYRLNPGSPHWTAQPLESLNRAFLPALRIAVLSQTEAGPSLRIVDGRREIVAEAPWPDAEAWGGEPPLDWGFRETPDGYWGCLGGLLPEAAEAQPLSAHLWAYRLTIPRAGGTARAESWSLPTGESYLDDAAREGGLVETVQFLPPSLAESPEIGLAFWRKRVIRAEGANHKGIAYELVLWTPAGERLVTVYGEYRSEAEQVAWRFHRDLGWIERPYIRWPQIAKKLGIEPWPVCAISPDGKQILYTCACDLRVVGVPD